MVATFVVEDGSVVTGANSYCTVAFADQYFEDYGDSATWSGATEAAKQQALRLATQALDAKYNWKGSKYQPNTQELEWPRYRVCVEGTTLDADEIPSALKKACCELALLSLGGTALFGSPEAGSIGLTDKTVKVGPISVSKAWSGGQSSAPVFPIVTALVRELIYSSNRVVRG